MPLKRCSTNGNSGWKWGNEGKCYTYGSGTENTEEEAKQKAINQAIAMGEIPEDTSIEEVEVMDDECKECSNLNTVRRYDQGLILDYEESEEGFLTVEIAITRAGVMPYLRPDGIRRELKHPDEIFSEETINSAKSKPVTNTHPYELVNPRNWRDHTKGTTHRDVRKEDNLLVVTETIFDDNLIAFIESGKKEQASIGFDADIDETSGTFEGEEYDVVQRNIRINHIAHVEQGRAGEEVKARLDVADEDIGYSQINLENGSDDTGSNNKNNGKGDDFKMGDKLNTLVGDGGLVFGDIEKIIIGDQEIELTEDIKEDLIDLRKELKTKHDEKVSDFEDTINEKDEKIKEKDKKIDELQAKLDSKEGENDAMEDRIEQLENKLEELENDGKDLDVDGAISERLQILDEGRKYLGADEIDATMDACEIKTKVIQLVDEDFDAEDKSNEYLNARYDATKATLNKLSTRSVGENNLKTKKFDTEDKFKDKRQKRVNFRE